MANISVRNISNRALSLNFEGNTITIMPGKVSQPFDEKTLENDFVAKTQLDKYVADREAKIIKEQNQKFVSSSTKATKKTEATE